MWRSLVARPLWERKVVGSNPAIPTEDPTGEALAAGGGCARSRAGAAGRCRRIMGPRARPGAPIEGATPVVVHLPRPRETTAVKSAVETLDATTVKLTVEVSHDELKPSIDHAYEHVGSQVAIPGFRKGKVPPRILDQRVGRATIIEHAVNDGLPTFYRQAITEANLRPLGQPEIEVTAVPALTEADGGLSFTAQVEVRPELDLPDLAGLTVIVDDVTVAEEDVDARLDDEAHRAEVEAETRASLAERILLDTLAERLAVKVSQEELLEYLVNASTQYGMDPNAFIESVDQQGQIPAMVAEVGRSKATAVALRRVRVVDPAGDVVDLSEFIGTEGETDAATSGSGRSWGAGTDVAADEQA